LEKNQNPAVAKFSSGYLLLNVYANPVNGSVYYDTVLYRKIKTSEGIEYRRGANLKPTDIDDAILIFSEAKKYFLSKGLAKVAS
jgi:hypothetical protein